MPLAFSIEYNFTHLFHNLNFVPPMTFLQLKAFSHPPQQTLKGNACMYAGGDWKVCTHHFNLYPKFRAKSLKFDTHSTVTAYAHCSVCGLITTGGNRDIAPCGSDGLTASSFQLQVHECIAQLLIFFTTKYIAILIHTCYVL